MEQEQGKSLDLISVKKKLEDYEQMLQYYTLMRMKNKRKDYEPKFEEWWEVAKEYFTKELEKILAQRRVYEIILSISWKLIERIFQILYVEI